MPRVAVSPDNQRALGRLGDAIRARRNERRMSQEALADAAGINRTHMGEVERGKRNVSLVALIGIAAALGCTVSSILSEAGI
ncbi:helix-turn-helix transcriptional regulator [Brevundimonas sp. 357]|uniref:helix-turn-helix transcriptional regulator n=1 Tax=Brevundimonas sp. 357 TaxID=2555782 RepID=UPI000F7A308E|nr:helix-turn-helix transcriptional regulator [Brevundimonas sp. 357]RSB45909.1 XRE family transcriptional regulator [Brevundimonas sp. 357]